MRGITLVLLLLVVIASFLGSLICFLIAFSRSEDLLHRIEILIRMRDPNIQEGRVPRLRAVGKFDMTCDHAFEYADKIGLIADHPEFAREYWRLRNLRNTSALYCFVSFFLLIIPAL